MTDPVAEFRAAMARTPLPRVLSHAEIMWMETRPMTRRYIEAIRPYPPSTPLTLLTALARILPDDDEGSFSFHPEGHPAVITPIFGGIESPYPMLEITCGDLNDLVAWHPAHDRVYTYHGSATLGCSYPGIPTVAHKSVLEWFRAGCEGVAVLRW